ncbi:hypothetical protein CG747_23105 [Streptomyces sp. CB02959]|nr:hypothetical protein CG747_23105 [Streptomyces sp. CB02959]
MTSEKSDPAPKRYPSAPTAAVRDVYPDGTVTSNAAMSASSTSPSAVHWVGATFFVAVHLLHGAS